MELLWNKLDLDRPPTSSWTTISETFDVDNFRQCITKIYNELISQDLLDKEAAILSRLIYRLKTKFRHDKGLKNMEKVNRALCNYLRLSLEKEYKNLNDSIVIDYTNTITLPTRQMLQYVLVRTQGFAKLMCRVQEVAFYAGEFLRARVIIGQAWTFSMITWASIARIWMLSRNLIKKCCNWYTSMYPFLNKLKLVGVDWLPSNYCLPKNLKQWLSLPWIDEQPQSSLVIDQLPTNSMFSLIATRDEWSENEANLTVFKEKDSIQQKCSSNDELKNVPVVIDDIGVRISRESFNGNCEIKKKKLKKAGKTEKTEKMEKMEEMEKMEKMEKMDIKNITTTEQLNLLLNFDSYPGLDKLQWNILRKTINKKLLKLSKCEDKRKQRILIKKIIRFMQANIT